MTTYHQSHPETIKNLFAKVAARYDLTNSLTSLGLHHLWNSRLVRETLVAAPPPPGPILDLCCGTGAIALSYLSREKSPRELFMLDFCKEMLEIAQRRAKELKVKDRHSIHFIEGDAQQIPLPDNAVSRVTVAYGIRNVSDPLLCLKEIFRVVQPNGRVGILELTTPTNPFIQWGHGLYIKHFLPAIGMLTTSDKRAYEYLCDSINRFVEPRLLAEEMRAVGFHEVEIKPLTGGIAHLITAEKGQ